MRMGILKYDDYSLFKKINSENFKFFIVTIKAINKSYYFLKNPLKIAKRKKYFKCPLSNS